MGLEGASDHTEGMRSDHRAPESQASRATQILSYRQQGLRNINLTNDDDHADGECG